MSVLTRLFRTHCSLLAAGAATVCLASGCGSSSATPTVPTLTGAAALHQPSTGSGATLAAFRAAIACARHHGMVGLPDPAIDSHGNVILPGLANPPTPTPAVKAACGQLINSAAALANTSTGPQPTAADLNSLARFARCMRTHGAPQWPDPDPNRPGQFTFASRADLPPAIAPPRDDSKRFFRPCEQFLPPSGMSIGFSGTSG